MSGLAMVALIYCLGALVITVGAGRAFQQGWVHQGMFRLALAYIALGLAGGNLAAAGHDWWLFELARDPGTRATRALVFTVLAYHSVLESWQRKPRPDAERGGKP